MATWKKVIVSGSNAELAQLKVDNLTSGQVVIGGGSAGNLSTTAINGTGNIVATTNATGLVHSGSFSGSFAGSLNGTASFATSASVAISASFANSASFASTSSLPLRGIITASVNASTITFTKGDSSQFDITIAQGVASSAATVTMNNTATGVWYPTFAISGSSTQSLYVNSASFQYNASTNTLSTTSSWAVSASNAISSAFATNATNATNSLSASTIAVTNTTTGAGPYYVVFTSGTTGNQTPRVDSSFLTFNADTNVLTVTASYASQSLSSSFSSTASFATSASYALSASFATSASVAISSSFATSASSAISSSFASIAGSANSLANNLTFGTGLSGSVSTYNGSTAVNVAISGSTTLTTGNHPKWTGTGFINSLISDNGTTVTIASGSTISAGGLNVTGNSTFQNNLTVQGDLSVAGTASFTNTDNLNVRDKFILVNSGSSVLADSGWITQYNAAGSGSAFYLEAGAANDHGAYGRFAVAFDVVGTSTSLTPSEYVVTAKINQGSAPTNAVPPTWGVGSNGSGNMWITNGGEIFIYG